MSSGATKSRSASKVRISVLIPSRDRLGLLRLAVDSVLRQADDLVQIVISDNASSEDYAGFSAGLNDPRILYLRSDEPLSVTENWNRALDASTGDYVVMLGDDDALAPGCFKRQRELIATFDAPDAVFSLAFHYAYPKVVPGHDGGYLAYVNNSPELFASRSPCLLAKPLSHRLGKLAMGLRHHVSFNAQHYLYSRKFILERKAEGPFYQSCYPDYFACFVTFMEAQRIVADSRPSVIVGISPKSFGYYLLNGKEEEGRKAFLAEQTSKAAPENGNAPQDATDHLSSWLEAALAAGKATGWPVARSTILRRQSRIRAMNTAIEAAYRTDGRRTKTVSPRDDRMIRLQSLAFGWRTGGLDRPLAEATAARLMQSYGVSEVDFLPIVDHASIGDAIAWLEKNPAELAGRQSYRLPQPPKKGEAQRGLEIGSAVDQLRGVVRSKDDHIRDLTKSLNDTVDELQGLIAGKDKELKSLREHILAKDAFIGAAADAANRHVAGLEDQLRVKETFITDTLAKTKRYAEELQGLMNEKDAFIKDALAKSQQHADELNRQSAVQSADFQTQMDSLREHIRQSDEAVKEIIRAKDDHIAGLQKVIDGTPSKPALPSMTILGEGQFPPE